MLYNGQRGQLSSLDEKGKSWKVWLYRDERLTVIKEDHLL